MPVNKYLATAATLLSLTAAPALAEGDPAAGEQVFNKCKACHTIEEGGPPRVGPNLYGVYGRAAGTSEAFAARYSKGLQEADFTWTEETLPSYLTNPREIIQGSRMAFQLRDEQEVADVIAYLKTQGGE
ncbi:c-type cytochrome [Algihabitans albus]|uniref:c-type cytochrome n=1 Tax=Algihabitans albus TaxID=2164067 RepID=UPI000E5C7B5E|nr:cytochrome c family protein [Algihabitans albus]